MTALEVDVAVEKEIPLAQLPASEALERGASPKLWVPRARKPGQATGCPGFLALRLPTLPRPLFQVEPLTRYPAGCRNGSMPRRGPLRRH